MSAPLRIYISGSITNNGTLPRDQVADRIERFAAAAVALQTGGFVPINPARRGKVSGKPWLAYMRDSLRDIADCDGLALLDGWEESRGAQIERELCLDLGIPVKRLHGWLSS